MIIIGEKLNGFIPATLKAIEAKDEAYVKDLAKKQSEYGSSYIDVCAGTDPQNEHETLEWLMKLVQETTDVPISIDSSAVSTIIDMIPVANKPGLINSVSGEGDKADKLFPVIADKGWNVVVLTCDDANGIPTDPEVKAKIAGDIIAKADSFGIAQERLFIDPLVTTLATTADAFASFGDAVRIIKERYPKVHITSGLSNISFGLPYRRSINRVFLTLAMAAGMDSAIIDPTAEDMRAAVYATEALLGRDSYCMNYLKAFKKGDIGPAK